MFHVELIGYNDGLPYKMGEHRTFSKALSHLTELRREKGNKVEYRIIEEILRTSADE